MFPLIQGCYGENPLECCKHPKGSLILIGWFGWGQGEMGAWEREFNQLAYGGFDSCFLGFGCWVFWILGYIEENFFGLGWDFLGILDGVGLGMGAFSKNVHLMLGFTVYYRKLTFYEHHTLVWEFIDFTIPTN